MIDLFDKEIRGMKYEDLNNLSKFPNFVSNIIQLENIFFGYKSNNLKSLERCVKGFLCDAKEELNKIKKKKGIIYVEIANAEICSVYHAKDNINFIEARIGYVIYNKDFFVKPNKEVYYFKNKILNRERDWIRI